MGNTRNREPGGDIYTRGAIKKYNDSEPIINNIWLIAPPGYIVLVSETNGKYANND